jgi:Arc/MetJ-type ribon-helix-helix transcriptional regulator
MRVHITLPDDLVAEVDRHVGQRGRSRFIARAVRLALDEEQRWEAIEAGFGALGGQPHEWDEDAAGWVRAQRHGDGSRVG